VVEHRVFNLSVVFYFGDYFESIDHLASLRHIEKMVEKLFVLIRHHPRCDQLRHGRVCFRISRLDLLFDRCVLGGVCGAVANVRDASLVLWRA